MLKEKALLVWPEPASKQVNTLFSSPFGVPLLRHRHYRGVDDLARHGDVTFLVELPVEGLHHPLQRPRLGQPVAKLPDSVLVGRRRAAIETEEPHPGEPVADHELHARVAQIVLRLQNQRLEHRH